MADLNALTRIDTPKGWRDALAKAGAGNPAQLAYLVRHCIDSIPADVRQELADFIENPVRRRSRPGQSALLSHGQVEKIRCFYGLLRSDDYGRLTRIAARGELSKKTGLSTATIRNVVEGRGPYSFVTISGPIVPKKRGRKR